MGCDSCRIRNAGVKDWQVAHHPIAGRIRGIDESETLARGSRYGRAIDHNLAYARISAAIETDLRDVYTLPRRDANRPNHSYGPVHRQQASIPSQVRSRSGW